MKIVVVSLTFFPAVGGLEKIMSGLALEWSKLNEVIVFTNNNDSSKDASLPYKVIRRFSLIDLYKAVKHADIFLEANVSLKTSIVGLLSYKKWWVVHHLLYNTQGIISYAKLFLTCFSKNIAVSNFVANGIWGKCLVINNFVDPIFKLIPTIEKNKSLLFIGRLVSDKGIDLLLHAVSILAARNINYHLSIVGIGPDALNLKKEVQRLNITSQVKFIGLLQGESLVNILNENKVLVVPSKWEEPFGLVALEALACGCRVVYSNTGGLSEAAGKMSFPFDNQRIQSLCDAIINAMEQPFSAAEVEEVDQHLTSFQLSVISKKYEQLFLSN